MSGPTQANTTLPSKASSLEGTIAGYDPNVGQLGVAIDVTNVATDAAGVVHGQLSVTGGGGGTQYVDGVAAPAHPTGTELVYNNAGTMTAVSAANPLPTSATVTPSANQRVNAQANDFLTGSIVDLATLLALAGTSGDANTVASFMGRLTKIRDLLNATLAISAASLPLPAGASTAAKQPALGTAGTASADVLSIQGVASMTPVKTDGSGVIQPVSIDATNSTHLANIDTATADLVVDLDTLITNTGRIPTSPAQEGGNLATVAGAISAAKMQSNISQIGGSAVALGQTTKTASIPVTLASDQGTSGVTQSTTPWVVAGKDASGASSTANPEQIGGLAATALPTAVANAQVVEAMFDKFGRIVTLPQAPRDLVTDFPQLTLTATTTETPLIAATANVFHDLSSVVVINTSATATQVDFRDSTAGTIRLSLYVPAGDTRGIVYSGVPNPQAAVNTAWTAQCGTAVTSVIITGSYISNK